MKKVTFILLLALIPLFMGCKEINLTMEDSGKTIVVKTGEKINITLVSNRSTGNIWRSIEYDKNVITSEKEPVYEKNSNKMIGAPGKVIYSFKAIGRGITNLKMEYGPVNKENPPRKIFEIKIEVK